MKDELAKGINLDTHGSLYGIERKRFLFFFREPDKKYRERIIREIEKLRKEPPGHERNYIVYVVKKGDNLWGISKGWLGDGRRYKEIADLNGIKEPFCYIYPGQTLVLPER